MDLRVLDYSEIVRVRPFLRGIFFKNCLGRRGQKKILEISVRCIM